MLLHHLGVKFEDKRYKIGDNSSEAWKNQKDKLGMPFPNLPYFIDGDVKHSETLAVLRSICRIYRPEYLGRNQKEQAYTDSFANSIYDLLNSWIPPYLQPADWADKKPEACAAAKKHIETIIACMQNNKFLAGNDVTYIDFMTYGYLKLLKVYDESIVTGFPKIVEYMRNMASLKGVAEAAAAQADIPVLTTFAAWQKDMDAGKVSSSSGSSAKQATVVEDKGICVGEDWSDAGAKDPDTEADEAAMFGMMGLVGWDFTQPGQTVPGMRKLLTHIWNTYPTNPELASEWAIYQNYKNQVTEELRKDIGGPSYHPNAAVVDGYVIKVKGRPSNQRCLIYFHGGAALAGTAEEHNYYCWRMAVDFDATIINVNYRLAPEHKVPCGIDDGYASVKWAIAKASELGIDPNRIATIGESGGGYIVGGVSMRLGERNEGGLIKFGFHLIPMVTNAILLKPDSELDEMGHMMKAMSKEIYEALGDYSALEAKNFNDKWTFTMCLDDDLCKKCPPAVVLTGEFDDCLIGAKETAEIYRRNNNLLVYGSQRGSHHGHYFNPKHCRTDAWQKAVTEICKKYL